MGFELGWLFGTFGTMFRSKHLRHMLSVLLETFTVRTPAIEIGLGSF